MKIPPAFAIRRKKSVIIPDKLMSAEIVFRVFRQPRSTFELLNVIFVILDIN